LRTFAVAPEPTPLYRRAARGGRRGIDAIFGRIRRGATAADFAEASAVIGDAGFTTRDDLVHGFVGGYFTLEQGMTIVIPPNVVKPYESAGVQTGELVAVTPHGPSAFTTTSAACSCRLNGKPTGGAHAWMSCAARRHCAERAT
jgi:Xaa-Pro dipeptidase